MALGRLAKLVLKEPHMTKGTPVWVLIYLAVLAAVGIGLGVFELVIDPGSFLGLDIGAEKAEFTARGWGGRNLALGVTAALALLLRDRGGMAVALGGAIAREVSDVYTALIVESEGWSGAIFPAVMLALDVVAFGAVIGSAWQNRSRGGEDPQPRKATKRAGKNADLDMPDLKVPEGLPGDDGGLSNL